MAKRVKVTKKIDGRTTFGVLSGIEIPNVTEIEVAGNIFLAEYDDFLNEWTVTLTVDELRRLLKAKKDDVPEFDLSGDLL